MDSKRKADQMMLQMKNSGYDLGEVADIEIPDQAIQALLDYLGNTFQCERLYIFEKNRSGGYDCTYEWCCSSTFSKKHLLQNLGGETVRPYYNYFLSGKKLLFRDIDAFMEENRELASILKPQSLRALICGQLLYDEADVGFLGIDNPVGEKFRELESIFDLISFYVAIQIHRRKMMERIQKIEQRSGEQEEGDGGRMSLYNRSAALPIGGCISVVYYSMSGSYQAQGSSGETLDQKTCDYIADVLDSIYGPDNVFRLGHSEFLAIYDHHDTEMVRQYAELSERTLASVGIHAEYGIAVNDNYEGYFFETVNRANADMLRSRRQYRNQFLEKYHMGPQASAFLDLLEIRPFENYYHFLYSEHIFLKNREGTFEEGLKEFEAMIHPDERMRFIKFWTDSRQPFRRKDIDEDGIARQNFTIMRRDGKAYINIEFSVVQFTDVDGRLILLCSTR